MNTLYIGPYRQYDYLGISSNIYLNTIKHSMLKNQNKIYSRPIYIDSSVVSENTGIYDHEIIPKTVGSFGAIIQHCPIDYFAVYKQWKNICIPIIDPKIYKASSFSMVQKLNHADHIMVNNEQQKMFLLRSNIKTSISICDENLSEHINTKQSQQSYDFGPLYIHCYNFGFIGCYIPNIQIIHKIILAFSIAFRGSEKYRLILFLRGTQKDRKDLGEWYNKTLEDLNLTTSQNISFIFNHLDLEQSVAALNSIDCLLSLNDDHLTSLYDNYILQKNKDLISKHNTETIPIPIAKLDETYDIEDTMYSVSTNNLVKKLLTIDNKPMKNKKLITSSIGDTICRILQ